MPPGCRASCCWWSASRILNVDPASTMQVVDALVRADKDFELLVVPNGEHTVGRSTGPVAYGQRREYDFFLRALGGAR
ncbi:prolyl oligopeptidase family serine peptidase [Sphingomonas sp. LR60]|uniref:prolyl oligopeptidase family serine peptidase n=1 Tax=Sphingomonas sp. LR60 TaxID=3050233 RepID=UPI002FE07BF2